MKAFLDIYRQKIDTAINELLPSEACYPPAIHQAMRYSALAGGKRLRGILALLSGELFTLSEKTLLPLAVAIECAHTYSLIHDDLPAMDNDDFRRGKPTNHKVFGEAVAILAGDALLTLAFQFIAELTIEPSKTVNILRKFAQALGSQGMVGGQTVDIESEGQETIDIPILQYIHTHKTGALINFSVVSGALAADNVLPPQLKALNDFGERLGLAFQVVDDILDFTSETEILGKKSGKDELQKKATYISLHGLEESRRQVKELIEEAKAALHIFPKNEKLLYLADYVGKRTH